MFMEKKNIIRVMESIMNGWAGRAAHRGESVVATRTRRKCDVWKIQLLTEGYY